MTDAKPLLIELKCGCGAALYIDCSPGGYTDASQITALANGWVAAHKAHHAEPKTDKKPGT
jgi:hypothetical protein